MFGFSRRKKSSPSNLSQTMRDSLFGDMPLENWPTPSSSTLLEPMLSFVKAREALVAGHPEEAVSAWRAITEMPSLDSRHYAQAWHFLRGQGIQPPAEKAKMLLGVVVEMPMDGGLDLLAAYPEHTARYYNYSGAAVVWEHANPSLDPFIDALLQGGERILQAIGPWEQPRPSAPPPGNIRISILAPAGLHFGQGPFKLMSADPLAKPAIDAATILMQQLIAFSRKTKASPEV